MQDIPSPGNHSLKDAEYIEVFTIVVLGHSGSLWCIYFTFVMLKFSAIILWCVFIMCVILYVLFIYYFALCCLSIQAQPLSSTVWTDLCLDRSRPLLVARCHTDAHPLSAVSPICLPASRTEGRATTRTKVKGFPTKANHPLSPSMALSFSACHSYWHLVMFRFKNITS